MKVDSIDILDEIDRIKGLQACFALLVSHGEHSNYNPDPIEDLSIVIDERFDKLTAMVKEYS